MAPVSKTLLFTTLLLASQAGKAAEFHFSIGGGFPYLAVPEVSLANGDSQRWYANYKLGVDDGFSLGFEQGLGEDDHHALGLFAGAVGIRHNDPDICKEPSSGDLGQDLGNALSCAYASGFSWETVNGVGLSYSYNRHGLNQRGFRIRFEFGYGEGHRSHNKKAAGNLMFSYQF
ncbi:hypothetical protein PVT67_03495 [Gallaecimonas kandeliae]|uniref:hypothetical protein n=1 Tax=Gallaecimonas kandeliae TaxID=3029055 RepID=UPI002648E2D0|nr:hypothetical protein [Gallaecimonas kandeliae]WKE66328.1 hypothetical protein PVT67_03495 [Gallaecimonas kandeliae]